ELSERVVTRRKRSVEAEQPRRRRRRWVRRRMQRNCQKRDLIVDFDKVGWSDWVIAPGVYNAGYCWGHCPFPLSSHYNATNHAIVLYLAHNSKAVDVRAPCCVPHKFAPLSLLHLDHEKRIVMELYEDMIVDGCSCR
ncbi:Bone morphogenetic protein 4, partial [Cichlidogyrus casuarinus]